MASDCAPNSNGTQPPPFTSPVNLPTTTSIPINLSTMITTKLHKKNFLIWRQHIEAELKANHLERFVVCHRILDRYLTNLDRELGGVRSAPLLLAPHFSLRLDSYSHSWMCALLATGG